MIKGAKIKRIAVDVFKKVKESVSGSYRLAPYNDLFSERKKTKKEITEEIKKISKEEKELTILEENSCKEPVIYKGTLDIPARIFSQLDLYHSRNIKLLLYQDRIYKVSGPFTDEEFKLLVCEEFDKERKYFERCHRIHNGSEVVQGGSKRERIPEKVKSVVWRRDQGKCARCGSREKIEYDHIIPIAQGGSNTARNIELLCERCNRSKGKSIQ